MNSQATPPIQPASLSSLKPAAGARAARHLALIPAAGVGARMEVQMPKQYMALAGKPMLRHALDTFAAHTRIDHIYIVVSAEDAYIDEIMAAAPALQGRVTVLRAGGPTRQESVRNGLLAITAAQDAEADDWILVHDAARPGLNAALIDRLLDELQDDPVGGLLALPLVDTIKRSNQGRSHLTVPRADLWAAQTPQMFRSALLLRAFTQAAAQLDAITDDASAIEMLGLQPKLVAGSPRNFKVTLAHDAALAEFFLKGNE
jgi:2-C-methyl-D-erythritol 4-phosphate cytidylyltransferase